NNLFNDWMRGTLARLLAIGAPDGTEGAMLGTPTDRLHRSPHVAFRRREIPSRRQHQLRGNASAFVDSLRGSVGAIGQYGFPDDVAIAGDDGVRRAEFVRLLGIEGGVDPAINYPGSSLAGLPADGVTAKSVAGMDPDAYYVAWLNASHIEGLQR